MAHLISLQVIGCRKCAHVQFTHGVGINMHVCWWANSEALFSPAPCVGEGGTSSRTRNTLSLSPDCQCNSVTPSSCRTHKVSVYTCTSPSLQLLYCNKQLPVRLEEYFKSASLAYVWVLFLAYLVWQLAIDSIWNFLMDLLDFTGFYWKDTDFYRVVQEAISVYWFMYLNTLLNTPCWVCCTWLSSESTRIWPTPVALSDRGM